MRKYPRDEDFEFTPRKDSEIESISGSSFDRKIEKHLDMLLGEVTIERIIYMIKRLKTDKVKPDHKESIESSLKTIIFSLDTFKSKFNK